MIATVRDRKAIGFDPMGVGLIIDALITADVVDSDQDVWSIPQGWKLNGPIKATEVKLSSGVLLHAGQAITAWAVSNAKAVPQGNAVSINKQSSGTGKIDPLMALFDAVALMGMSPAIGGVKTIYSDGRALRFVAA
jgi:phage terminase large subunit-like protein